MVFVCKLPLPRKWSKFSSDDLVRVDNVYGIYELGNRSKRIIYIGRGLLLDSLLSHLREHYPCTVNASFFRIQKTGGSLRAEQRERSQLNAYRRKHGRLPKCNRRIEHA